MEAIRYSHARANLAKTLDSVVEDHAPMSITRQGEGAVVVISLADDAVLAETAYLLRGPANARRLWEPSAEVEQGTGGATHFLASSE